MEWSNKLSLEFIQIYEKYPVLWNAMHHGHKNRNALSDAWQKIRNEFSIPVSITELRKKKQSLMAAYRSLRKKVTDSETTGSGSMDVYKPSWIAFTAIDRFIRATVTKAPSLTSEEDVDDPASIAPHDPHDESALYEHEHEEAGGSAVPENSTVEETATFSLPQPPVATKKQRFVSNIEAQVTHHLKQAGDALQMLKTKETKAEQPLEAAALYGQLLAEKLRKLSPQNRLIVQNQIDNLIFQAQIAEYDAASPSSNLSTPESPSSRHSSSGSHGTQPSPVSHYSSHNSPDFSLRQSSPAPSHVHDISLSSTQCQSSSHSGAIYTAPSQTSSFTQQDSSHTSIYSPNTAWTAVEDEPRTLLTNYSTATDTLLNPHSNAN